MSNFDDEEFWELSPNNSHPNAVAILTDEFYWDCADDNSPFGNDTGADTLADFREWREQHPTANPIEFLNQLLEQWEVTNDFWNVTDSNEAQQLWKEDEFSFRLRDESVIALAFGQLLIEGKVDAEPKRRALLAIERQLLSTMIENWEDFAEERVDRLEKMKAVLEKFDASDKSLNSSTK
ncbi:MAG: hypothetical protein M3033_06065 [Acidobacteriota bacterium]|nr:hypothetical protein [Acidobacteriota bacterium]